MTLAWIDQANHAQLGDPVKGAALIVEVASTEKLPTPGARHRRAARGEVPAGAGGPGSVAREVRSHRTRRRCLTHPGRGARCICTSSSVSQQPNPDTGFIATGDVRDGVLHHEHLVLHREAERPARSA
ncbi:Atu4866 domain-containing protein [Streptomyces sp. NPDC056192]|uniref:Atu4866 domain-containing protein n=1 Tax=unclassified Streptomyces TaxID=2593676 RepID=UPI0035D68B6B